MNKNRQLKTYFITINNPGKEYAHEQIKRILSTMFSTFSFAAMCDEIGELGTYHTHVVAHFDSAVYFNKVKKYFPTAHIDSCRSIKGTIEYLKKEGKWADTKKAETSVPGTYEELGTIPSPNSGKNMFYQTLYHMVVDEELSTFEIISQNQDYIGSIDVITRLRTTVLQEKYKGTRRFDMKCIYCFGKTGSGKSRSILDEHGDENVYRVTDYQHPFDQYEMQKVIVFEEFRSGTCPIPLSDMLMYMDIYPMALKARYANKYACYNRVYFATNLPLEDQYIEQQHKEPESWAAFLRRISEIREYLGEGKVIVYHSVEEYFKAKNIYMRSSYTCAKKTDSDGFRQQEDEEECPFYEEKALVLDKEDKDNEKTNADN